MKCLNCGHEQAVGNYCSKCGTKFAEPLIVTDTIEPKSVEPNVYVENIKKKSKKYIVYFVQQLKKPSVAFNRGESELTSSLISIVLFTVLFSMSLFLITKDLYWSNSPSFLSFFLEVFFLTFFMICILVLSLFLINNFFGPQYKLKAIISFYGGHLSLLNIGVIVSILLMLVKSFTYGNTILTICLLLAIFILPLYVISYLLIKNPTGADPLYGFILYIATFTILFILFVTFIADSTAREYFGFMKFFF
ncbi:hypothetical protein [Psychrobacillus vulpis]|uniref:Zinc ribbon domain-containing protein n=1 Tax=Psychrobacillus vulpis TaxID=2325572 RepID=A0A544TUY9_9BACI|nr:hypothetical protein [Psychrobacillus vulpis]TQR21264.1 hypothetical protein FG384_03390 [Psychrobacillus vulpis]